MGHREPLINIAVAAIPYHPSPATTLAGFFLAGMAGVDDPDSCVFSPASNELFDVKDKLLSLFKSLRKAGGRVEVTGSSIAKLTINQ
jgi:hypothetical protein